MPLYVKYFKITHALMIHHSNYFSSSVCFPLGVLACVSAGEVDSLLHCSSKPTTGSAYNWKQGTLHKHVRAWIRLSNVNNYLLLYLIGYYVLFLCCIYLSCIDFVLPKTNLDTETNNIWFYLNSSFILTNIANAK